MNNITKRKRFISFILLSYFLFYAITPLSFNYINKTSDNSFPRNSQYNVKNLHLYIFDVICSYLSYYSSAHSNDSSLQFILLKKKRAVLPECDLEKSLKSACYAVLDNGRTFFNPPVLLSFVLDKETKPSEKFESSFSGLSPPHI